MRCPHGVRWWTEPTSDQVAAWARDGVRLTRRAPARRVVDRGEEALRRAAALMPEERSKDGRVTLQDCVLQRAAAHGWLAVHFQAVTAVNRRGGTRVVTPFRGRRGFVDTPLVHEGTGAVVMAELKAQRGRVEPDQQAWLDAFTRNPAVLAVVWRPEDWYRGRIDRLLTDPARECSSSPPSKQEKVRDA